MRQDSVSLSSIQGYAEEHGFSYELAVFLEFIASYYGQRIKCYKNSLALLVPNAPQSQWLISCYYAQCTATKIEIHVSINNLERFYNVDLSQKWRDLAEKKYQPLDTTEYPYYCLRLNLIQLRQFLHYFKTITL